MIELSCTDFQSALDALCKSGLRLDMIMPADDPHIAELSGNGVAIRLVGQASRAGDGWRTGRAGMQYRDLLRDERVIASHIRVPDGGPVADYVHYHAIRFQMIYCYKGWVRLVYEDQGEPFTMHAGECVLQPPLIRHRVLECSAGLEVIEVATPALHATHVDHDMQLPNGRRPRTFDGQRFVHLRRGFADREMTDATCGIASVRIRRDVGAVDVTLGVILAGSAGSLVAGDSFHGSRELPHGSSDLEWLEVNVR